MIITEEMKKAFPLITEEEVNQIRVPEEELIEKAVREFNIEADKIDSEYDRKGNYIPVDTRKVQKILNSFWMSEI